jgi:KEOPS complex subunit Cgi121
MEVVEAEITVEGIDSLLADLDAIGAEYGVAVQALDARYIVDREHLRRAVELADRAFERGDAIARDRNVEIMLYAAGTRQIDRALTFGLAEGTHPAVVVIHAPDSVDEPAAAEDGAADTAIVEARAAEAVRALDAVAPASTLGEYDPELVREWFGIDDAELDATDAGLAALVRERVALLTVEK